ncbi:MAG TPA: alpha/beta fold hydrolase [Gemmatimonadaceae bacterium]|nr:alpha/beta fold hydrolase [Gemmatimonadaceae bacterium]
MIALCAGGGPSGDRTIEIAYDDVGGGVPLVLLHGFPHDRSLWAPQRNGLVDRARCITPDLRGFGGTPAEPPFTIDRYADDVVCLLNALGVERAVVGGLSMGGYVALALWRRHRARVRGLVLADTRAGADDDPTRERRREMIALARSRDGGPEALAERMIVGMVGKRTRERSPALVESVRRMLASVPVEGAVGALEAMMARPDSTPLLATVDVPTLVVVGDEDVLAPVREARVIHEGIRGSRLEVIAGAGHVSNVERPAAFNHVVREFLAGIAYD